MGNIILKILLLSCLFITELDCKEYLPRDINFNVYRNGSLIGKHSVSFEGENNKVKATINIKFKVKFLGFTVYDYHHKNYEIWSDNLLTKLNSETNQNGTYLNCNLKKENSIFNVEGSYGKQTQDISPVPTSYWNKEKLVSKKFNKVLNTQDCSYIDFKISEKGEKLIYDDSILSDHYKLIGEEHTGELVDIDIWYDKNNEWVKMIFVKDGSTIEYFLDQYDKKK